MGSASSIVNKQTLGLDLVDTSRISIGDNSYYNDYNLQRLNKFKTLCLSKVSQVSSIQMLLKHPSFLLAFIKFLSADFKFYNQLSAAEIRIIKTRTIFLNISHLSSEEISEMNESLFYYKVDVRPDDCEKMKAQCNTDDALMIMTILKFLQSFRYSIQYAIWKEQLYHTYQYLDVALCVVLEYNPWSTDQIQEYHVDSSPIIYSKVLKNINEKYYKSLSNNIYLRKLIVEAEGLPVGVTIHAINGDITEAAFMNEAYCRITGASNEAILNSDFSYLNAKAISNPNKLLHECDSLGIMKLMVLTSVRDDGGEEYEELIGTTRIRNINDNQTYMIAIHTDISLGVDKDKYRLLVYDLLSLLPEAAK